MEYLLTKKGNIPLVISVPHGGMEEPANLAFRREGNRRADLFTLDLAGELEASLQMVWGRPYLVSGLIGRSIIDYNRPPEEAYEDPAAACHYRDFHTAMEESSQDCLKKYGVCLLVDIHGSRGAGPGAPHVILGTRKFTGMPPGMVKQFMDLIAGQGWRVRHDTGGPYRGGFIIRHYASGGDIWGIQLEITREVRQDQALRAGFSSSLAHCLHRLGEGFGALRPKSENCG